MTTHAPLTHGTWVLVGDGSKVLILREEGHAGAHQLHMIYKLEAPSNPATAAQGADAPGKVMTRAASGHSAVEQTDWHAEAERAFLADAAKTVAEWAEQDGPEHVVVVAPPRALATLRQAMPASLRELVVAEIARDYVHHPLPEIARLLGEAA